MIWLSVNFEVFMRNFPIWKILPLTTSVSRGDYPLMQQLIKEVDLTPAFGGSASADAWAVIRASESPMPPRRSGTLTTQARPNPQASLITLQEAA